MEILIGLVIVALGVIGAVVGLILWAVNAVRP